MEGESSLLLRPEMRGWDLFQTKWDDIMIYCCVFEEKAGGVWSIYDLY